MADNYFSIFLGYLPSIIGAVVLFFIGLWIVKLLCNYLRKVFDKRDYDPALKSFLLSIIGIALKIILVIIVIAQLGIQTSSLVALFGAAGLAVGLAMQGALANFAGGVMLIILKPFRIGDWVEVQGESGTVSEISIFYTSLINAKNLRVVIPNGQLSNHKIINYSVEGRRKDFITVRVAYGTDIEKAREVLLALMKEQKGTFSDPAPQVVVGELTHDCVSLSLRFVSSTADFWTIHWAVLEHAEKRLTSVGIELPYPQYKVDVISRTN